MYKLKIFTKKKKNQKEKIIVNLKNLVLENILCSIRNYSTKKIIYEYVVNTTYE